MLNCGHAVFDDLRQGVEEIEFLADPTAGEVRIGGTTPLLASFVSTVIERLHRRYPRMVFSVVTTNADALLRDLDQRNLDLLFLRKFGPFAEDQVTFEVLYDSPSFRRRTRTTRGRADSRCCCTNIICAFWSLQPSALKILNDPILKCSLLFHLDNGQSVGDNP